MTETVEQWMHRTYKPARFRNELCFHADREKDVREQGYALISHHDSVTGRAELYRTPPSWWRGYED
jgi:hypothetical protein